MASRVGIFIIVSLFATLGDIDRPKQLIVWNVGQGQWLTLISGGFCHHMDMGGEFAPWATIVPTCRDMQNSVSLSHWDWDHISFVRPAERNLPNICLLHPPIGKTSAKKKNMLLRLRRCGIDLGWISWVPRESNTSNDQSRILLSDGVLTPGDSSQRAEKKWVDVLPGLNTARVLILGHHGSRTSTSNGLLQHLPNLRVAIASARYRRYRHPHIETMERLRQRRIPLLKTEDWGNIHIYL